jgi:hypothetical protein
MNSYGQILPYGNRAGRRRRMGVYMLAICALASLIFAVLVLMGSRSYFGDTSVCLLCTISNKSGRQLANRQFRLLLQRPGARRLVLTGTTDGRGACSIQFRAPHSRFESILYGTESTYLGDFVIEIADDDGLQNEVDLSQFSTTRYTRVLAFSLPHKQEMQGATASPTGN